MAEEKNTEKIDKPESVIFKFKDGEIRDVETTFLETMHDAQLKKMLAYVGLGISSFIPQLQLFLFLLNRPKISDFMTSFIGILSLIFLCAQVFFVLAIATKFHEIKVIESKLGFDIMYNQIFYRTKPLIAKIYDWIWKKFIVPKGVSKESTEEKRFWKANIFLNASTSFIIFVSVIIWLSIIILLRELQFIV